MEIYLLPAVTAVIGLWMMTARKEGEKNAAGIKSPVLEVAALMVPQKLLGKIRLTGALILVLSLGWTYQIWSQRVQTDTSFSGVGVTSVTFESGDWNPRLIDFRTSAERGIHVIPEVSLELYDVQVFAPGSLPGGYYARLSLFANETVPLGGTKAVPLLPGTAASLGEIVPQSFQDPDVEHAWRVDPGWKQLLFRLDLLPAEDGEPLATVDYTVQLAGETESWYIHPPYASFVSVVYSVNEGPDLVLDLRSATQEGIDVKSGDRLRLREIWAKSLQDSDLQLAHAEAYPSAGQYDGAALVQSDEMVFRNGPFNLVSDDRFQWTIAEGKTSLVLTLTRDDSTLLDRYVIPFRAGPSASLLRLERALTWPQDAVTYLDFEDPGSLQLWKQGWGDGQLATFELSDRKAFSGSHSAAVTVTDDAAKAYMLYDHPVQAHFLVGQVFWPQQEGIGLNWAQVCVSETGECAGIPLEADRWNTFVFDLSQKDPEGRPQTEKVFPNFYIQGHVLGASASNPYTFYVDGIQLYPVDER